MEFPPIIFHDFIQENSEFSLIYSQDLKIPFDPKKIGCTAEGFLYHDIQINDLEYGLLSSELSVKLYEKLQVIEEKLF